MCKGTINEFYVRLRKENIIMNNIEAIEILKKRYGQNYNIK